MFFKYQIILESFSVLFLIKVVIITLLEMEGFINPPWIFQSFIKSLKILNFSDDF